MFSQIEVRPRSTRLDERESVCVRVCACASDSVTTNFEKCDKIFPQKNEI